MYESFKSQCGWVQRRVIEDTNILAYEIIILNTPKLWAGLLYPERTKEILSRRLYDIFESIRRSFWPGNNEETGESLNHYTEYDLFHRNVQKSEDIVSSTETIGFGTTHLCKKQHWFLLNRAASESLSKRWKIIRFRWTSPSVFERRRLYLGTGRRRYSGLSFIS